MTEKTLPPPLVPAEIDLSDYPYMPLHFRRLFKSDTWVLGDPEEKVAAFHLWCEAWHQKPAGSLPKDDRMLAHLSAAGPRWKRLKQHALRGWSECSDERLYHPVIASIAMEAWEQRREKSRKGKAGASARWGSGNSPGLFSDGSGIATRSEGKGSEGKGTTPPIARPFVLPDWISREAWEGFEQERARSKHPLHTDRAKWLIVADLEALRARGQDPNACLDQSTRRGWRGVFEVKEDARGGGAQGRGGRQGALEQGNRAAADNWANGGGHDKR